MTNHKFTADRSDMAHRIKTLNGRPFDPAPINREMISNPRVEVKPKVEPVRSIKATLAGYERDGRPIYIDTSSTDD